MRLLVHSNAPWIGSGYGNQTRLLVPRLNTLGYPTAIAAFCGIERGVMNWDGVLVYPKLLDRYGNDAIPLHAKHWKADALITLCDITMLQPQAWPSLPWLPWVPLDSEELRPSEVSPLKRAFQPIAMSRFGEDVLHRQGFEPKYAPHAVDAGEFRPGDQGQAREGSGLPKDAWIVGVVAANQGKPPRKAFPEMFRAFREFKHRHPDAFLYVHSYMDSHLTGPNLVTLLGSLDLKPGRDWMTCQEYQYLAGMIGSDDLRNLYCSFDVLLNPSWGEGFGIPILEAAACGVPSIVGDWSAMSELNFSGWAIDKRDARPEWSNLETWQYSPNPGAIVECLEAAYSASGVEMAERGRVARARAVEYDVDAVVREHWLPILAELESTIANRDAGMVRV